MTDTDKNRTIYTINVKANSHSCSNVIKTSKYTLLTFIPLNLFYQFQNISNLYFLFNMSLALIPNISPITPISAVLPLLFIVIVTMIRDGFKEYAHRKSDLKANSSLVTVLRRESTSESEWCEVKIPSSQVQVGDYMKVSMSEEIMADLVLLSSSNTDGLAYINTVSLDGETNLKTRKALKETQFMDSAASCAIQSLEIKTGPPSPHLSFWNGVLKVNETTEVALSIDQFLYRSARLKNTDWIWGVVVFTGTNTKLYKNMKISLMKNNDLRVLLNRITMLMFMLQQLVLIFHGINEFSNQKSGFVTVVS